MASLFHVWLGLETLGKAFGALSQAMKTLLTLGYLGTYPSRGMAWMNESTRYVHMMLYQRACAQRRGSTQLLSAIEVWWVYHSDLNHVKFKPTNVSSSGLAAKSRDNVVYLMNSLAMMLSATDRPGPLGEFGKELGCAYQSDVAGWVDVYSG